MATNALSWEVVENNIAVITFDQPESRANTMGQAVLGEFEKVIGEIEGRKGLGGLILRSGKPGMFIAGADLKELGSPERNVDTARASIQRGLKLIERIESLPFPTAAAIEGSCMGGGLELAMAFDYRVISTHPKTELGLPETKVGLFPGWGGTQRLPRLVGPSIAAEMIASGEPANAKRAVQIGLAFDAVPGEQLIPEAFRLLKMAQESGEWQALRKQKRQPVGLTELQHGFTFAVAKGAVMQKTKGQYPAPLAALEVMEKSCNKTLEEGQKIETDYFLKLLGSDISRNLIAVFFMNNRIQKDTGVSDPNVKPKEVKQAGVLGAGIMGGGIAGALIRKGVPVMLLDPFPGALEKGVKANIDVMKGRIGIGRMTPEEMAAALGRLSTTQSLTAMSDRDIVIEAIIENEEAKVKTYQELQKHTPADSILASNTSTISITRMAKSVRNPELFAGMHYFNPVDRMQLVEVIRGEKTGDQTVATLVALAKKVGKSPIVVKDCPGFLVNRILFPYINEAMVLLEEGAEPRAVDKAATAFGMPMGPVFLQDVVGIDTAVYAGKVVNDAFANRAAKTRILDELMKAGRLGQKTGAGFFSYAKDPRRGADDPALAPILEKCRTAHRTISPEEIVDRLFLPMFLEATRCLSDGIARDPADVDMGLILGIGFPPWRGGILRWADAIGMDKVLEKLKKYEVLGPRFQPTDMVKKLAAEKRRIYTG